MGDGMGNVSVESRLLVIGPGSIEDVGLPRCLGLADSPDRLGAVAQDQGGRGQRLQLGGRSVAPPSQLVQQTPGLRSDAACRLDRLLGQTRQVPRLGEGLVASRNVGPQSFELVLEPLFAFGPAPLDVGVKPLLARRLALDPHVIQADHRALPHAACDKDCPAVEHSADLVATHARRMTGHDSGRRLLAAGDQVALDAAPLPRRRRVALKGTAAGVARGREHEIGAEADVCGIPLGHQHPRRELQPSRTRHADPQAPIVIAPALDHHVQLERLLSLECLLVGRSEKVHLRLSIVRPQFDRGRRAFEAFEVGELVKLWFCGSAGGHRHSENDPHRGQPCRCHVLTLEPRAD